MAAQEERRSTTRYACIIDAQIKLSEAVVTESGEKVVDSTGGDVKVEMIRVSKAIDISEDGACLEVEQPIEEGKRTEILLRTTLTEPIKINGWVVWCSQLEKDLTAAAPKYSVGVAFTNIEKADRRNLQKYLKELESA